MQIADVMSLVVPPVTEMRRRSGPSSDGSAQPMFSTIIACRNDRVVAVVRTPRMEATLSCATAMSVGLDAQALVVAAPAQVGEHDALAYSVMTRDLVGALALQQVEERDGVHFGTPVNAGEPDDPTILQTLAEALSQAPLPVDRVRRQGLGGTFGDGAVLPPELGRVVVDAGTVSTLQERVQGIGGQALYLPRSPEAGRLALESGVPRACLVESAR